MAPYVPEEVDVFTVPHSRMKELVHNYFAMVQSTNFTDGLDLNQLLECLSRTFIEFKSHEQIENRFIMKRLKIKLKRLSIRNTAVCNCHKDNALTDMMKLLQDGYKKKTDQDRLNYGLQLKKALEDFTKMFLPHMREEEEIFQPLLLQYFSYEELCELKQKVLQHHFEQELQKTGWLKSGDEKGDSSGSSDNEYSKDERFQSEMKWAEYVKFSEKLKEELSNALPRTTVRDLPPEIVTKIFQYLQVQDLCECVQVSPLWNMLAMEPSLWRNILPGQWARGDWSFHDNSNDDNDDEEQQFPVDDEYITLDDDADIDESEGNGYSVLIQRVRNEARILAGLSRTVLPQVGASVQKLVLANCRTLTNGMLQRFLSLCPNVEHLDLSQTRITDAGLRRLGKNGCGSKLKTINLSGCVNITDATMVRLAMALSSINSIRASNIEEDKYNNDPAKCRPTTHNNNVMYTAEKLSREDDIQEPPAFDQECLCEKYYEMCNTRLTDPCVRSCRPDTPVAEVTCACLHEEPDACNVCGCDEQEKVKDTCKTCDAERNQQKDDCDQTGADESDKSCSCGAGDGWCSRDRNGNRDVGNPSGNSNRPKMKPVLDSSGAPLQQAEWLGVPRPPDKSDEKSALWMRHNWKKHEVNGDASENDGRVEGCNNCRRVQHEEQNNDDPIHSRYRACNVHQRAAHARQEQKGKMDEVNSSHEVSGGSCGHAYCTTNRPADHPKALEDCIPQAMAALRDKSLKVAYEVNVHTAADKRKCCKKNSWKQDRSHRLESLNLSGCYQVTDLGLRAISGSGAFPYLEHLDVSGLFHITAACLHELVTVCPSLHADNLFYCDNILEGPFSDTASGCRNLQCGKRVCCRSGD